jgi:dihydropteroate synthase
VKEQIMAIGNVTPDSFYAGSRLMTEGGQTEPGVITSWAKKALDDGADILDIGACSTRPGSTPVSETEEWTRLEPALKALRASLPGARLSLDTFRPSVARKALDLFGPMIINDVSGGNEEMYHLVAAYNVPYVFTFRGNYASLDILKQDYTRNWILDPGLGFCGGVDNDYACLSRLDSLRTYNRPVLVGLSRKSMIYKPTGLTPDRCLEGTQALQLYALEHGASILRTHDVRATAHTIKIWNQITRNS